MRKHTHIGSAKKRRNNYSKERATVKYIAKSCWVHRKEKRERDKDELNKRADKENKKKKKILKKNTSSALTTKSTTYNDGEDDKKKAVAQTWCINVKCIWRAYMR